MRRFLAVTAAASLVAVLLLPGSASAAAPVVSQGAGTFLSGTAAGTDLATIVELAPATAQNVGGATTTAVNPLDASVVNALTLDVSGVNLFGSNGLISIGAVNQYASASPDGSSSAASGAVDDSGAIAVGGSPGNASIDLTELLSGAGPDAALSAFAVTTGALSGTATQTSDGAQSGTYQVASLAADLTSPLVATIKTTVNAALGPVQTALDGLQAALGAPCVLPDCTVSVPDLQNVLGTISLDGGSVAVDLDTGTVHADLAALVRSVLGVSIDDLPAGRSVLPLLTDVLSNDLLPAIQAQLTAAINGSTVTPGTLQPALDLLLPPVVATLQTSLTPVFATLGTTVLAPLATAVGTLAVITLNNQDTAGGAFTETALRLAVLPSSAPATVNLAAATVGPNNGPVPTITSLTPDSGPAAGVTSVTVTGTGFLAAATVSVDGGAPITPTSINGAGTSLTFTTPPHTAGPVDVTVTTGGGTSAAQTFTFIAAPPEPVITAPADGSSTNDSTPVISGTGEDGATVTVVEGGTTLCSATVALGGGWSCTPADLTAGPHTITATQQDPAGNTSPASAPVTFTIDTTAPGAPVITSPADGSRTSDTTPATSGTGEDGATVTVVEGGTTLCAATVGAGTWSCTPSSDLTDGSHTITATQQDPAGNTSPASAPVAFTIDTVAPAITAPADGSATNDVTVISGTGDPGASVTVHEGATTICTATVVAGGTWSCAPVTPLATGPHTTVATQTDAGDRSADSAPVTFTVDTAAPAAPAITSPADGSSANDTTPAISGTGEPGASVTVVEGGTTICTGTVVPGGIWSCAPSSDRTDGSHTITATQQDPAGNTSPTSAPVTFTIDTTTPAAPVITSPADGSSTSDPTPSISGTGEPGDTVAVVDGTTVVCTVQVAADGTWWCTSSSLADGTRSLIARQTDPAGNTSPDSDPRSLTANASTVSFGGLAITGAGVLVLVPIGLLALVAGLLVLAGSRRRRTG